MEWPDRLTNLPTTMVNRTLRSGQSINSDGNVVVLGDVNPGAEVSAVGHIVVMGALRGVVHAGSTGNEDATITALDLVPTQLRIATHITRPPDGGSKDRSYRPETARIRNDEVIIEEYNPPK